MNPLFASLPTSIFEEMSVAARDSGAINLGQGFPDEDGPIALRQAAAEALVARSNQYPPMRGLPELRQAVADHYRRHQALDLAPDQVLVTSGATEAIAACLFALIASGDEVLLIQPMYDAYLPLVLRAGGVPRLLTLTPPDWRLTEAALAKAIGPRTRLMIFNDPHNPLARAFSADEVALLARACIAHDLIAICDEVWEHVRFDGHAHYPLIAERGMAERAIKIGSAGKIFAMTGWKVGWTIAAPALIETIARAHQYLAFCTPPALQVAAAQGLALDDHLDAMRAGFQRSRDRLACALADGGYAVGAAEATYFLTVDLAASGIPLAPVEFCRRIVRDHGVAAIPLTPFYAEGAAPPIVRLCFAKQDATIDEAARRLVAARRALAAA